MRTRKLRGNLGQKGGYSIDEEGNIYRDGAPYKSYINRRVNRRIAVLYMAGRTYTKDVARLMLMTWKAGQGSGPAVFLNGDTSDCRLDNLDWRFGRDGKKKQ